MKSRMCASCTLVETANRSDISAALPGLVEATAEEAIAPNATRALCLALDFPGSHEKAREVLKSALSDHRDHVAGAAAEGLALHNTREKSWGEVTFLLQHDNTAVRHSAFVAMEWANEGGALPPEAILALAERLSDNEPRLRAMASSFLSDLSEGEHDISPAIAPLAKAASDEQEEGRKDAIWALYGAARQGTDITDALPALEECMKEFFNAPVASSASVAVASHYLQVGRHDVVRDTLETDTMAPFGAAWAFTDH